LHYTSENDNIDFVLVFKNKVNNRLIGGV